MKKCDGEWKIEYEWLQAVLAEVRKQLERKRAILQTSPRSLIRITCHINLSKSYRSTVEISRFSRKLLHKEITEGWIDRRGKEPDLFGFPDISAIKEKLREDIKEYRDKGYHSIGIITRTVKEADDVYRFLCDKTPANIIRKDDD